MRGGNVTWGDVVAAIGREAADLLSAARGGRNIYIPLRTPGAASPLAVIVGMAAAAALAEAHPGASVDVQLRPGQRAEIRRLRKDGRTIAAIAAEIRCTKRHVYHVLAEDRPAPETPPLLARMGVS